MNCKSEETTRLLSSDTAPFSQPEQPSCSLSCNLLHCFGCDWVTTDRQRIAEGQGNQLFIRQGSFEPVNPSASRGEQRKTIAGHSSDTGEQAGFRRVKSMGREPMRPDAPRCRFKFCRASRRGKKEKNQKKKKKEERNSCICVKRFTQ